jgi:hypothetical protein
MEITRTSRTFVRNGDLGVDIHLTLEEAKRIRAALGDLDGEDLDNYGGILEVLRKAIPQQWSR